MTPYVALFTVIIIGALFASIFSSRNRIGARWENIPYVPTDVVLKTVSEDEQISDSEQFSQGIAADQSTFIRSTSASGIAPELYWNRNRFNNNVGQKDQNVRFYYCLLVGVALISLCGLRAVCVGYRDNVSYANGFYEGVNLTFHDVVDNFLHPKKYGYTRGRDFTFYIMSSFCGKIFPHHQYFFYLCAIMSLSGYIWLIYRYSTNPALSFLLLVSLGTFSFSMTGIRQAIALGICCFSYKFLTERKLFPFMLVVLGASLFHKTAVIFFPAYWLYSIKISKRSILYFLLAFGFILAFRPLVNKFFMIFSSFDSRIDSYMENDTTKLTSWGFIISCVVFAFCCFEIRRLKQENDVRFLGLFPIVAVSVLGLLYDVVGFSIFYRLVMYYSLYRIILVPRAVSCIEDKHIRLGATIGIGAVCVFYFFQGITNSVFYPYLFFWEDSVSLHFNQLISI